MNLEFLLAGKRPVDLRKINWPGKLKLLVTAPHPDDFDAIGVTLRYMVGQGHELYVVVAETGSGIDKVYGVSSFRFFIIPATARISFTKASRYASTYLRHLSSG